MHVPISLASIAVFSDGRWLPWPHTLWVLLVVVPLTHDFLMTDLRVFRILFAQFEVRGASCIAAQR